MVIVLTERKYEPQEVDRITLAFPADVRHLMPDWEDIPDEFKRGDHPFCTVVSAWFSLGLNKDIEFHLYEDIDGDKMLRHLMAIMGSFQPKHQHKMAAVAYLLSLWCGDIKKWEKK